MFDVVIKNGTAVTAVSTFQADIGINNGKIAAIGSHFNGKVVIDASNKWVIPGGVDIHVHLEMPIGRFTSTDDFYTGTKAAAFGGTTTIIDFVETQVNETMTEAIARRRAAADPKTVIDYGLHMTIGPADIPRLYQLEEAFQAGATTFKLYMAYGLRLRDDKLFKALTAVHRVSGLPVVHAENWDIITTLIEQNLTAGRTTPHWHPRSRPAELEAEAVGRLIDIASYIGVPVHIFHVSTGLAVERIAAARAKGKPVTGETCPQYLYLTWDAYDAPGVQGALPVCSPPIRAKHEQDALWQALACNHLQVVTTDHCPFTAEEKATGLNNYSQIPGGVPSIEMRMSAIYQGVINGLLTPAQWVAMCATTPARLAGLAHKGHIAVGYDADLVIWDPHKQKTITPNTLHEKAGWTPYDGLTLTGWPEVTMVRGRLVTKGDEFVGKKGYGRYIHRTAANL